MEYIGRSRESSKLEELAATVRTGRGQALVVRGEAGIGKSALIERLIQSAPDLQFMRAVGVESEMELPFGGLHQLCAPLLDLLPTLPGPQRDALDTVFGFREGGSPDRLLVGLAALSLLCQAAEHKPLLCVVDDGHWLDRASAQALAFVGRRLLADPVGVVICTRHVDLEFSGLPALVVGGLGASDAMALLCSLPGAPLDGQVRDRIVAEARGNPLALLEWHRALTPAEAAGGSRLPGNGPLSGRLEESFRRRLAALPAETQRLLLVAAAEPVGDVVLVWRAADRLGVRDDAALPAVDAGLIEVGTVVRFTHPLVRSAAYWSMSSAERQRVHRALADTIDADSSPDRRAWHRALATPGPDEAVAAELERSARRAQARGGLAAAGAFLERSANLTLDLERRAQRTIAAAAAHLEAGSSETATTLLAAAEAGPLDGLNRAYLEGLRGNAAVGWGHMGDATRLFLSAARRLEPLNVKLGRDSYMRALVAADLASDLARGATIAEVAKAAKAAPAPPGPARPQDLLLEGLAIVRVEGPGAAAPALREALGAFATVQLSPGNAWWLGYCQVAAALLWDYDAYYALANRFLQAARDLGALLMLPWALEGLAHAHIWGGDFATAASVVGEAQSVIEATGSRTIPFAAAALAAWRGHEAEARSAIAATIEQAGARGQGGTIKAVQSVEATLWNGLGDYQDALIAAQSATRPPIHSSSDQSFPELAEAAVRAGRPAVAAEALERLSESTQASGTDWALGVEARSRALLSTGSTAEALYLEAIERLDRSPVRPEAARAHLLFGEWLRRQNRRVDARHELRTSHEMLVTMGAQGFAERARRELLATGETVRKRRVETAADLTDQEACIARLVADGLTNTEIGAQLFISARTVEWHLRKVFTKLEVGSRQELRRQLRTIEV
jgi:DNA-binding CsgD family transcriptional regulator/tetratricopeptide (TPR) repeat protein